MADIRFVLTPEQEATIRGMEKQRALLEGMIVTAQRDLLAITERLRAVAILTGDLPETSTTTMVEGTPAGSYGNMTEAVEKIANESETPVPRAALKRRLADQGFPADRLGNYFYTAVHRLKERKRISVLEDGSVWKAPDKIRAPNGASPEASSTPLFTAEKPSRQSETGLSQPGEPPAQGREAVSG